MKTKLAMIGLAACGLAQGAAVNSVAAGNQSNGTSIFLTSTWGVSALSASDDYYIKHDALTILATDADAETKVAEWPGNSLHVAASFQPKISTGYTLRFPGDGLFLDAGGTLRLWDATAAAKTVTIDGTAVTVTGGATLWSTAAKGGVTTFDIKAPFKGSGTLTLYKYSGWPTYPGVCTLRLLDDCTAFSGTVKAIGNNSTVVLGASRFAGTVELGNRDTGDGILTAPDGVNASIARVVATETADYFTKYSTRTKIAVPAADTFTVGTLTLTGGVVSFANKGSGVASSAAVLAVTDGLRVSGTPTISYPASAAAFGAAPLGDLAAAVTVLTLPEGAGTLSAADFALDLVDDDGGLSPADPYLAVRTVGGVQHLVIAYNQPIVYLKASDSGATGSSLNTGKAANWSDGNLPAKGKRYYVPADKQLMTQTGASAFAGDSLTVAGTLALCGTSFDAAGLTFVSGAKLYSYNGNSRVTGGTVTFAGTGRVLVRPDKNLTLTFAAPLAGTAGLNLQYRSAVSTVAFEKDSPDFLGKISFSSETSATGADAACLKLAPSTAASLGGPLAAYAYDALTLSGGHTLAPAASVTFTEQTRGVYIDSSSGRMDVADGLTLGLNQPLTWRGILRKIGAGVLAVGGPAPKFFYGGKVNDAPLATGTNLNLLQVVAGALKPVSAVALDGCQVNVASTGTLLLDGDPADADLRARGVVNTKWATPFAAYGGATTIRVEFDFGGEEPVFGLRDLGLCTVKTGAVTADLFSVTPPNTYAAEILSEADEEAGTTTFTIRLRKQGLVLVIK